jgi:hypothetical protein
VCDRHKIPPPPPGRSRQALSPHEALEAVLLVRELVRVLGCRDDCPGVDAVHRAILVGGLIPDGLCHACRARLYLRQIGRDVD